MTEAEKKVLAEAQEVITGAKGQIIRTQDRDYIAQQVSYVIINALNPILAEINKTTKEAVSQYVEAIREIRIEPPKVDVNVPDVNVPKIDSPVLPKIELPEIKIPEIKIPEIKISTEKIEQVITKAFSRIKIEAPKVEVQERKFPDEIKVKGIIGYFKTLTQALTGKLNVGLEEIDRDNPLHVVLVDTKGKYYKPPVGAITAGGQRGETNIAEIDLSSQCDGSNTTFDLGRTVMSIILANLNGTLISYTLNTSKNQITTTFAPDSGEELKVVAII